MLYRFGIAVVAVLCACSIESSDPDVRAPEADTGATTDPGSPGNPDTESLPPAARLVAEPVDSVEDVPGRYAQPFALPGQISLITLEVPTLATGQYESYRSCGVPLCVKESGQYHIVPTNPAIGFAAISLSDATGAVRMTYILDLLWRDADGALVAVQVRPLLGNLPGATQVWWRLPDTGADPDTDPDSPVERVVQAPQAAGEGAAMLPGVYVRALPVHGDIGAITLGDATWTDDVATGAYQASYPYCLPWCLPETGTYVLELSNVATGTGHLQLIPSGRESAAHDYVAYATWRTPDGSAAAIQLQRVDGVVPSGPPFVLYRQWWSGTQTAAPADAAADSCTYVLGLAQYYRIRALQCGTSACYGLEPYYRSWVAYYDGLAARAGCAVEP